MTIKIQGTNSTAAPGITGGDTDTGVQFGTNEVSFVTGGTNRATVESNGNFTIENGNLVLASDSGIDFSATGDATTSGAASTSELLNDYEVGTWTATISFDTGTTGITYQSSRDEGHYVKIGKLVLAYFRVHLSSKGSSTGDIRLNGLPYTAADTFSSTNNDGQLFLARGAGFNSGNVGDRPVGGVVNGGQTYALFQKRSSDGDTSNLNNSDIENDWDITGMVQYFAT